MRFYKVPNRLFLGFTSNGSILACKTFDFDFNVGEMA